MANSKRTSKSGSGADLGRIVGEDVYATWVLMLKTLVPGGRTHRLSVVVASMLMYASCVVDADADDELAQAIIATTESADPDDFPDLVRDAFTKLFKDAGVQFKRTSSKGEGYSILEEAFMEYANWESYPWD